MMIEIYMEPFIPVTGMNHTLSLNVWKLLIRNQVSLHFCLHNGIYHLLLAALTCGATHPPPGLVTSLSPHSAHTHSSRTAPLVCTGTPSQQQSRAAHGTAYTQFVLHPALLVPPPHSTLLGLLTVVWESKALCTSRGSSVCSTLGLPHRTLPSLAPLSRDIAAWGTIFQVAELLISH